MGGARCVTDLAAEVGLSQSCTTRHLQSLQRRRLVSGRRDGKRVYYRIREDDPGLMPLLGWALSEPTGAAGVRALRLSRMGAGPGAGRKSGRFLSEPAGDAPSAGPDGSAPAPGPDPQPSSAAPPRLVRRSSGSDIEDYLL